MKLRVVILDASFGGHVHAVGSPDGRAAPRAIVHGAPMEPSLDDAVVVESVLDAARASVIADTRVRVEVPSIRERALDPFHDGGYTSDVHAAFASPLRGDHRMADWDVIAKQRLTEDWGTLRSSYLPLNQAMRRTVDFLEKGQGTFDEVMAVARERLEGSLMNLGALVNRRSPWVRLEAIRNIRVLGTGLRGAASDDPMALLRFLFAISELLTNVWKDAPTEARVAANLKLAKELDFWFGCDCCAVGVLQPTGPDDPPDLLRGKEVRLVWEVDALFAWTLDEFEDYLASERYSLPTTSRLAAVEDVTSPILDVSSDSLRRGKELFGGQGGGLFGPLDLRYLDIS